VGCRWDEDAQRCTGLEAERNVDPEWGLFRDYTGHVGGDGRPGVVFPADVRNCTTCHATDAWKTRPSRLACAFRRERHPAFVIFDFFGMTMCMVKSRFACPTRRPG
jgi:hypothetical protein